MQNLLATDLAAWLADASRPRPILLDVREPWEVQTAQIAGSLNLPLRQIPTQGVALDQDAEIVCLCHHGARSAQACRFLEEHGFNKIYNLQGGIDAWSRQIDATIALY
jgi:rhodanese-related sulfurtransferase